MWSIPGVGAHVSHAGSRRRGWREKERQAALPAAVARFVTYRALGYQLEGERPMRS